MTSAFEGRFNDAAICTIDGRPCWIAAIYEKGKLAYAIHDCTSEHDTAKEARAWLQKRLRQLGAEKPVIRDTTSSNARAFSAARRT